MKLRQLARPSVWGLPFLFLMFLLNAGLAVWRGPYSHSFVAMVFNGFILVIALIVLSALPAPKSKRRARTDQEEVS